jgi:energy-coupling factor transport system permease protein
MFPMRSRAQRITYQPGDSIFHRLHPLVKMAWLLFGSVLVFVLRSPWLVVTVVALLVLAFTLAGLRLDRVRGTRLFITTALLLGLLQILFVHEGETLLQIGPLVITVGGLQAAAYVAGRFLSVILLSYLFVLTTALRLVPVFEQEGQTVYHAQLARGVQYDVRSPRRFVTLARQFFLPLLVSALGKVDALAVSMEGRCFGKYPTRTFVREVHATRLDWLAVGLLLAAALAAALLG